MTFTQLRDWCGVKSMTFKDWLRKNIPVGIDPTTAMGHMGVPRSILDDEGTRVWLDKAGHFESRLPMLLHFAVLWKTVSCELPLKLLQKTKVGCFFHF